MVKLIWLLVRLPHISPEQFREHYENVHSKLGKKHLGHLMSGYVRNFPSDVRGTSTTGNSPPVDWPYDCIAEWHLPDEAALAQVWQTLSEPDVAAEFRADEPNFLDLTRTVLVTCREGDVIDNGTVLAAGEQAAPVVGR
ncbi:MAG TPA: EthD domain-containing protein [Novosphingobium sp.]|nr:EthD domain-containing protein [Novosphingobium sp.]